MEKFKHDLKQPHKLKRQMKRGENIKLHQHELESYLETHQERLVCFSFNIIFLVIILHLVIQDNTTQPV